MHSAYAWLGREIKKVGSMLSAYAWHAPLRTCLRYRLPNLGASLHGMYQGQRERQPELSCKP